MLDVFFWLRIPSMSLGWRTLAFGYQSGSPEASDLEARLLSSLRSRLPTSLTVIT